MNLQKWLSLPPYNDKDQNSLGRALYAIQLALAVIFILAILLTLSTGLYELAWIIGISGIPLLIEIWLVRHEHVRSSGIILVFTLLGMGIYLMYIGDGLIDIAILLLPAVIIVGSMLFTRWAYILLNAFSMLSLTWIAYEQSIGHIATRGKAPVELFGDWVIAILILPITALASYVLAESMRANLRLARENEASLSSSNRDLEHEIAERKRSEQVQLASRQIAEAALTQNLADFYRSVHSIISPLIPAGNFYITLYDAVNNIFTTPFLVDEFDTKWPSYPPGKGLGAYVLRTGKPLLTTPETFVDMERQGLVEILDRRMVEWLGVPLKTREGKIIGVMAVQNYSGPPRLESLHMDLLVFVSVQVAMAIERMQAEAEREKLIQELTAKNAELERFTYTVSHDLKSPLVTISGFLGYLEADVSSGNMKRFELDKRRIQEAVDKMRRLLNELLELSRIGRLVNAPEIIPFADLVQDALNVVHGQLEERGVTVAVHPNLPVVYGDRHRLTEVLQNLVDNAVKFMGDQPSPQIEIGQRDKDANMERDEPVLFVRDNGIGIEPKYHEQVFGLFNKLNPDIEGTGIGLALVKRIIEVHKGRIWVESELNQGSTFLFTLPAK